MKKRDFFRVLLLTALALLMLFSQNPAGLEVKAISAEKPDNLQYSFTSLDGKSVSTAGEAGKVKVIVFGRTTCGNTMGVIRNIANSDWVKRSDIQVIFAECAQASLQTTQNFAKTYGCEDITFCYDENYYSDIASAMWEYHDLFYEENQGALPFTVFIDGENKVGNVLTGMQTAGGILTEINKCAEDVDIPDTDDRKIDLEVSGTENYAYVNEILKLVNQERAKAGAADLRLDQDLLEVAMQRAAELSVYYSHTRPDGTSCFTASNRGTRKSENIAVGYRSPQNVMTAWMNSSGHKKNILDADVTSIGIGCFQDTGGTWHWVQFFDNAAASEPSVSGSEPVTRTVSVLKSNLHLETEEQQAFAVCVDKNKAMEMEIFHRNTEGIGNRLKLPASHFEFTSSNPSAAAVSGQGMITVKGTGIVKIMASLKGDTDPAATRTITITDHKYQSKAFPAEGYTLYTCSACGHSYKALSAEIPNVSGLKTASTASSVKLSWNKIDNADGYEVYQYQSAQKKWNKLAVVTAGKTSHTVKKLKSATGYRFAIKAYKIKSGKKVLSKSYASLYTATNPTAVKFKVTAGKRKALVKWSKVKGATSYTVFYKTGTKGTWKKLKNTKKLSFTKKKLKSGKTYTFAVKAHKVYKGKTYTSAYKEKKAQIR